jgi:hypothetical protein
MRDTDSGALGYRDGHSLGAMRGVSNGTGACGYFRLTK